MAGKLGETVACTCRSGSARSPCWPASPCCSSGRAYLHGVDHEVDPVGSLEEAEAVTVGS